ncbi:hypothetical protein PHYSODRAFT_455663, partial [Phytophthora sojae]
MMLAQRFRQVLHHICQSSTGLSLSTITSQPVSISPQSPRGRPARTAPQPRRHLRLADTVGYQPLIPHAKIVDPGLARLTFEQRRLRQLINNDHTQDVADLRKRRNRLLHEIRERSKALANEAINAKLEAIENAPGTAQMFEATKTLFRRRTPLTSWIAARAQRYKEQFHILGIDLTRVFDTINRDKLLSVLATILDNDELRLIRLLLRGTQLSVRHGHHLLSPFESNTGTPQ